MSVVTLTTLRNQLSARLLAQLITLGKGAGRFITQALLSLALGVQRAPMRAMTQELAVVCPHRHRVRTAGRAHRALLLRPDLRSTLRNRVPVAGMRRRPRFSRAHDGQPGSPHRGTRQRNAGLWDNRPGSARAEEPLAYPEFSRLLHPLRVPPGDPLFGGSGPPSGGSRSPPLGPRSGGPGRAFRGRSPGVQTGFSGPEKRAKIALFRTPATQSPGGVGGLRPLT